MVWWTWILLWVALIAVSLLFFGFLAWRLFRGFTALMEETGRASEALTPSFTGTETAESRHFVSSVFRAPTEVRAENALNTRLRRWARLQRRVRRRVLRRQPQLLRDLPHL
ncbi:hypothetical protein BJ994_001447 [Arthrobacter pigmenti]|uniref:Uncharacterized protein n=1 Tax=Arthrobacter pigmenti TaxID=271432 RepID=A0A846RVU1_9MICC|nr:hypothetical protein [Arthrobacter pigmenti]NJC22371.1 hypothetical protein [Arthrobacter pigmenti]